MNDNVNVAEKERVAWIDIAKGIGIFLVVLGHTFPDASSKDGISNAACKYIFDFVYIFHMPLFFFVSGYLSKKIWYTSLSIEEVKNQIYKKMKRLVIPYFLCGFLYIPLRVIFAEYSNQGGISVHDLAGFFIGRNPYSGLWFLYILFVLFVITIVLKQVIKLPGNVIIFLSFLSFLLFAIFPSSEVITWILRFWIFYILGLTVHIEALKIKWWKFELSFVLLIAGFSAMKYFECEKIAYILTFVGIFTVISFSYQVNTKIRIVKFFEILGNYSMEIYIIHGPLLSVLRVILYGLLGIHYYIYCVLAILVTITVSLIATKYFIRKYAVLNIIVNGLR